MTRYRRNTDPAGQLLNRDDVRPKRDQAYFEELRRWDRPETIESQESYLREAGFPTDKIVWQREMGALLAAGN